MQGCMERPGLGEMQIPSGLWSVFSALWAVPGFRRFTPRHPPRGCFRYGYERLSSSAPPVPRTSALFRAELGAALVWGKEGILPPARAPPRSFGVRPRTTPFLVFISAVVVSLPLREGSTSGLRRRSSLAIDAKRQQPRG